MDGDLKQFKTIKDIDRSTAEGELAYRLLMELWQLKMYTKANDLLRLVADKTYIVRSPKAGDICFACKQRK